MDVTFENAGLFLVLFTVAFILMDEYIAKPIRRARLEKRAKTEPRVREVLEIAKKVAARHGGRHP